MKRFRKTLVSVALMIALIGSTVAFAASSFTDVKAGSWYSDTIDWGVQNNIAAGYPNGSFKPNTTVTEEEFLALLVRSFEGKDVTAATTTGSNWSDPFYEIAKTNNYPISGQRGSNISRTSVAEIIAGTQGKNYVGNDAIQYLLGKGLANGKTSLTIKGYIGSDTLTRAEAIQFVRNVLSNVNGKELLPRPTTPSPKSELPSLPVSTDNVVGKTDPKLATQAAQVQTVVSNMGFSAGYNGDTGAVFVADSDKRIILSYTDSTRQGGDYTTVVTAYGLLGTGQKVDQGKIDAIVASLKTLGLPVDATLGNAMADALGDGKTGSTVKFGSTTVEVVSVGYGKLVMYVG
jgi:hypothetical protein